MKKTKRQSDGLNEEAFDNEIVKMQQENLNVNESSQQLVSSSYSTRNFITNQASLDYYNYRRSISLIPTYDESLVSFDYTLKIDIVRLLNQAWVFAEELISREEIDKRYLFGNRDYQWRSRAMKVYLYSFCKSYLYGVNSRSLGDIPGESNAFIGHTILFNQLKKLSFIAEGQNDVSVQTRFLISDTDKEENAKKIYAAFPFIARGVSDTPSGGFIIEVPRIELVLNKLASENHIIVSKLFQTDESVLSQLSDSNRAFGNAYLNLNSDVLYYIPTEGDVTSDPSYSISKANLISGIRFSYGEGEFTEYYYRALKNSKFGDPFTKFDVESITNLKCRHIPRFATQEEMNIIDNEDYNIVHKLIHDKSYDGKEPGGDEPSSDFR